MKLSLSDKRGEGDQDVIGVVRSAASAALWTDSSRGGGEQRAESRNRKVYVPLGWSLSSETGTVGSSQAM